MVFIGVNFTIALLLIRKTWDKRFLGKVGDEVFLKMEGDPSNGENNYEMGGDIPLGTM